jgi:hypothetical protein
MRDEMRQYSLYSNAEQHSKGTTFRGPAVLMSVFMCCIPTAAAESFQQPLSSIMYGRNGLRLESASLSTGYFSAGTAGNLFFLPNDVGFRSDVLMSGAASILWSNEGERSHTGLTYTPSYQSHVINERYGGWNHSIGLTGGRELSRKWNLLAMANAMDSTLDQLLFTPTTLGTAVSLPATFEDFASNLLTKPLTSGQIAASLNGSPIIDQPSRAQFYGSRIFSASANVSLTYAYSTRTKVTVSLAGSRTQPLSTKDEGVAGSITTRAFTNSTSANAGVTVSHAIDPRTDIGVRAESTRAFSTIQDAYNNSAVLFLGRRMGRRWFVQGHGGPGTIVPVRQTYALPAGVQYRIGATMGFMTRSHTFLGEVNRNFGDTQAIGATSTFDMAGAWRWATPWRSWSTRASVQSQQLKRSGENIRSWQVSAATEKVLNRQLSCSVEYAYISYDAPTNLFRRSEQHAVRASLIWSPSGPRRAANR